MNSFWMVAIVFLFVIVSPVLLAWIIETGVSRLGAIIVVGSRSLYRSEEETIAFFGKRFEAITRARGRVLLVDGLDVRALKEPDAEEALSVDELAALVSRQCSSEIRATDFARTPRAERQSILFGTMNSRRRP